MVLPRRMAGALLFSHWIKKHIYILLSSHQQASNQEIHPQIFLANPPTPFFFSSFSWFFFLKPQTSQKNFFTPNIYASFVPQKSPVVFSRLEKPFTRSVGGARAHHGTLLTAHQGLDAGGEGGDLALALGEKERKHHFLGFFHFFFNTCFFFSIF